MAAVITKLKVPYNSQRDNYYWGGALAASAQCFYTSVLMFLSAFIPAAATKDYESAYVDDVEVLVGKPGIGEIVMKRYNWIKGRTGAWFYTHRDAVIFRLAQAGIKGSVVCRAGEPLMGGKFNFGTMEEVSAALKKGSPVVISTKLTSFGHIVCIVGETEDAWIVHDPYGNALLGYRSTDGSYVEYPKAWFNNLVCNSITGVANANNILYLAVA
jgi:hypothetical protein